MRSPWGSLTSLFLIQGIAVHSNLFFTQSIDMGSYLHWAGHV